MKTIIPPPKTKTSVAIIALASVVLFGGCNFEPKYAKPVVETPATFKELTPQEFNATDGWKTAEPKDDQIRGQWWEVFHEPELNAFESQVTVSNQSVAAALANFLAARAVVKHFKGAVAHWEIWNEPDHPIYWQPQDNLEAYARLLKRIYPVLKEADPQCQVLIGGLTNTVSSNLERLYEQAGAESFDIVNIHPFVSPLADRPVEELRRMVDHTRGVMQRYGDGAKPIWVTEIGCPGSAENQTWWLGKGLDENRQAEWVASVYAEALRWENVEKIFWAFFRDTQDHFKDAVDHFGLVRHDFTPKAAYAAYRAAARRLTPR